MRKAIVTLTLVGLVALASAGGAHAQRYGYGSYYGGQPYSPYYGGYGSGYTPYYGGYGYGYAPYYGGYGNTAYYRGYGNAPYYPSYGYANEPSSYSAPTTRQSFYDGPETAPQYAAVTIVVPSADAQVWFGNTAMPQRGTVRLFHSPSLEPGKHFTYAIKARWMEQGNAVERDRQVNVQAGQKVTVDFRDNSEYAPAPDALRPINGTPLR